MVLVAKSEWTEEADAEKAAHGLVETWNQYLSGDVYGVIVEVMDETGAPIDDEKDSCWGYYGFDYANQSLSELMQCKKEQFEKEMAEMKKKLAEKDAKIKELEEKSKDKKLSEKETELAERENKVKLAEEKAANDQKLAEKKGEFDKMLADGKVVEAQRKFFMEDNFAEFAKNAGAVNLSEKGSGKTTNDSGKEFSNSDTPAQDEVISLSEKKVRAEKGLSMADAQKLVLSENPELNKKYEKEVAGE